MGNLYRSSMIHSSQTICFYGLTENTRYACNIIKQKWITLVPTLITNLNNVPCDYCKVIFIYKHIISQQQPLFHI